MRHRPSSRCTNLFLLVWQAVFRAAKHQYIINNYHHRNFILTEASASRRAPYFLPYREQGAALQASPAVLSLAIGSALDFFAARSSVSRRISGILCTAIPLSVAIVCQFIITFFPGGPLVRLGGADGALASLASGGSNVCYNENPFHSSIVRNSKRSR